MGSPLALHQRHQLAYICGRCMIQMGMAVGDTAKNSSICTRYSSMQHLKGVLGPYGAGEAWFGVPDTRQSGI
jgi:hypothetical protein